MTVALNFTKHGDAGEALIILHGLFGNARNWQGIAQLLTERYCVYTLDLRNHASSPHADLMDYPSMSADVASFMDQQGLLEATILGHSMGGKVAMQLAMSEPDKVSRLIVVDIAPVTYKHNFDDVLAGLHNVPLDKVRSRKEADQYLAEKINVLSLRQFLLQNLVSSKAGGFEWRVNLASIEKNMPVIMGFPESEVPQSFGKQTLFINGEKSTYLAPRYRTSVAKFFPVAEFETVPKAGHWPHIESPSAFMEILNKFLG
ncbi:MAG TPA: alpha/beta fold hydrolase [Cycloclasticus sp.]|jgi:esterase|nr:alpha/beta fold hydrolase [Cycloclasticus sp.]HIL92271.1 alpha/beta fold hydrolase [Cycloclasticus sp.]